MTNIKQIDKRTYLHLDGYDDIVWRGWLYKFHTGTTAKERDLRAYRPRMVEPIAGMPGRFQESGREDMYVADTGRKGDAKWAVYLYGDEVATSAYKGTAQGMLHDLLLGGR